MSIAAVNSHFAAFKRKRTRDYMTNVVMCPSHLVNMWKREIEARSPRSEAVIIKDFSHLISLMPLIKGKNRHKHLWLVLSKEIAKLSYELRPVAEWKEHKRCTKAGIGITERQVGTFCCPCCGKPLYYTSKEGRGRYQREIKHFFKEDDFREQSVKKNNLVCTNEVTFWNKQKNRWDQRECGTVLWGPSTKQTLYDNNPDHADRWVKLPGKGGWIQRRHCQRVYDRIISKSHQTAEELQFLTALADELNDEGVIQRAPVKYPIARFIKKYLKGYINYSVLDECHQLKGKDSLQGEAMGDIISAAKYTLALTGTLLNGFCSGIFYLLFRMFPHKMKKEGYDFRAGQEFSKDYGVQRSTRYFELRYGQLGKSLSSAQVKELPGVSPLVFTKFLLGNAVFISLDDIADALPSYEEIPIPLAMPDDLRDAYHDLSENIKDTIAMVSCDPDLNSYQRSSMISQMITLLSVYPDQPYDQPTINNPETGAVVLIPPEVSSEVRIKENALLSLCQEKIAAGEHVLVYYSWTNRTDIKDRVSRYLESFGIRTAVLTAAVKSQEREAWINEQVKNGVQVLFTNPSLIETGLTLLDFTTIIFYQVTYNLYTMRQASRRSWRINQDHDVQVYFLYYQDTVQEQALSLMATKLQAAMAIEGKFSEEGLNAMSNNEDILTQIATSVTEGIKETLDVQVFQKHKIVSKKEAAKKVEEEQVISAVAEKLPPFPLSFKSKDKSDINEETQTALSMLHKFIQDS